MPLSECSIDMLRFLGLKSVDELFSDIPAEVRISGLRLPKGMSELELRRELESLLSSNRSADRMPMFLGAGVYNHFIPAAVKAVASRSEFVTSYTPYQPEISQGMLQALFEYQSYMTELTGMDVVNSSMYDGSTALGEAILMSHRISGGNRFLLSRAVSPEKKAVARTYAKGANMSLEEVAFDMRTGTVDLDDLRSKMSDSVAGFYYETPNFLGPFETRGDEIRRIVGSKTLVVGVNPMSLALVRPPSEWGADIVIGDAQVFGTPMNLGGPTVGIFACRSEHVRKMPGRIIGLTVDLEGRPSYCMTLQTREQHIRRSKATSNICTNEALLALAAAAYLSVVGRTGLREIARKNVENMRALSSRIGRLSGFKAPMFEGPHFNEFVALSELPPREVNARLLKMGVHGGYVLESAFPELGRATLYCTTEMHTKADHDMLIRALEGMR